MNNNKIKVSGRNGFTLIEIIVVIVILGILASIAVPSAFSWIQKSKAAEAFAALKTYKDQMEACLQVHVGQEAQCYMVTTVSGNFKYGNPYPCPPPQMGPGGLTTTTNCNYPLAPGDNYPDYDFYVWPANATDPTKDVIQLHRTGGATVSPTITCSGTGIYAGLC